MRVQDATLLALFGATSASKKYAVAQQLPIASGQGVIDEDEGTLAITAMERARHHLGKASEGDSIVELFAQVRYSIDNTYSMAEIVLL